MRQILTGLLIAITTPLLAATPSKQPDANPQIQQFIKVMVKDYGFKDSFLQNLLAHRKPNQEIIKRITFPYESKPWTVYRKYFITDQRVANGIKYWNEHKESLAAAEKKYGVPASVIVAIIGVESNYGTHAANFNEMDALSTLAFYYPKREQFFKKELKQYLIFTRQQKIDPNSLYGSYAGALGIPQFMPSSYRHYGVDFSQNGKVDLLNDHKDAIGSIANYLSENGWRAKQPVATQVTFKSDKATRYVNKKSSATISHWKRRGVNPEDKVSNRLHAKLIEMGKDNQDYWLVFKNFRAIMSYNPRTPYAMAVYQLSKDIQRGYEQQS